MCGIVGFLSYNKSLHKHQLATMTDAIAHRGPDAEEFFVDEKENFNVGLGHRRLSILDLSTTANQPMRSHCGRYLMIFNGEVYNYQEIAREKLPNVAWKTHSDSEVILECFAAFGIECIHLFNGMFAIAWWDTETEQLYLVRDRLGIKPIVYYKDENNFAFASEIKSLLSLNFPKIINEEALRDYFFLEYIPGTNTSFKNYEVIPAGHYAIVNKNNIKQFCYWNVLDKLNRDSVIKSEDEYLEELDHRFKKSVKYRMISDVPIGAFLSGGTDSSMVCTAFQQISAQPINTFTIGFDVPGFDETQFAQDVANQLHSNHRTYKITESDALPLWEQSHKVYDEPFAVSSVIPSLLVCKKAKQHVTVALAGDGGDELFFGYGYYEWYNRLAKLQRSIGGKGTQMIGNMMDMMGGKFKGKANYFSHPRKNTSVFNLWSQEQEMFSEKEVSSLFGKPYEHHTLTADWEKIDRMQVDNYTKIAMFDIRNYLAQDLLYKMDIASMANSLEVRLPYLDYQFVEWAINVPTKFKINGTQKYLPKKHLEKSLTNESIYRKKWGFPAPTNKWFKGELKNDIEANLKKDVGLNHEFVQEIYKEYLNSGTDRHGKKIFALVQYIKWKENYG